MHIVLVLLFHRQFLRESHKSVVLVASDRAVSSVIELCSLTNLQILTLFDAT